MWVVIKYKKNEFSFLKTIKGKSHYDCEKLDNLETCEKGFCKDCEYKIIPNHIIKNEGELSEEIKYLVDDNQVDPIDAIRCGYYRAVSIGKLTNFAVYNYHSFLTPMKYDENQLPNRNVLIFDEAHNYDDVISEILSGTLKQEYDEELLGYQKVEDFFVKAGFEKRC